MNNSFDDSTNDIDFTKPEAFVFDLDGTLLDSTEMHLRAFIETLKKYSLNQKYTIDKEIIEGRDSASVFSHIGIPEDQIEKLSTVKRQRFKELVEAHKIRPFKGSAKLLRFLKSVGKQCVIATGSTRETCELCLKYSGLDIYFDEKSIFSRDKVKNGKPSPDIFELLLMESDLNPDEVVVVEDADIGIEASNSAGIKMNILVNKSKTTTTAKVFPDILTLYHNVIDVFHQKHVYVKNEFVKSLSVELSKYQIYNKKEKYDLHSDCEILFLFDLSAKTKSSLRLLRIGGPLWFRKQVVDTYRKNNANTILQSYLEIDNRSVSVLLSDPDDAAFLARQDCEGTRTWGIWRVRHEILVFASAMASYVEAMGLGHKIDASRVGFHKSDLIWNIGIVGNKIALVRSYGQGTGHDGSATSHLFTFGAQTQLAESFDNYWESISRHPKTRWLSSADIKPSAFPKWPSLYKGNAVLLAEEDLDKEDTETKIATDYIVKVCISPEAQEAEQKFQDNHILFQRCKHFRPVPPYSNNVDLNHLNPFNIDGSKSVFITKITGISLFEIATNLCQISTSYGARFDAERVLGELLNDSIEALKEFRECYKEVTVGREKYNYEEKIVSALKEVKKFVSVSETVFDMAIDEAKKICENLKQPRNTQICDNSEDLRNTPFRDAHLKNRIWKTDKTVDELVKYLLELKTDKLRKEIYESVVDIDFETAGFDVTEWDDVIHLLYFENSGAGPIGAKLDGNVSYEKWWSSNTDDTGLWCTVVARSTRELCRRLWYARTMPNTYQKRYKLETGDFFLKLALHAMDKVKHLGVSNLKRVFAAINNHDSFWDRHVIFAADSSLVARHPVKDSIFDWLNNDPPDGSVFISYSHNDAEAAMKLAVGLNNANVPVWLDKSRLSPGVNFDDKIRKAIRSDASYFISLISTATESDRGSYVHIERTYAADISQVNEIFYIPVIIDDLVDPKNIKNEPEKFKKTTQYKLLSGEVGDCFIEYIKSLVDYYEKNNKQRKPSA